VIVVVFRSRLHPACPPSYGALADRMLELARSMPGFVSFHHYEATDGERVSLVEFESEETARAWRAHAEHRAAQERGRSEFYAWYRIQICEQLRESRFDRGS